MQVMQYLFRSPETHAKWPTGPAVYYTKSRIDTLVTFLITSMILLLMVLPVYALWRLSSLSLSSPSSPSSPSSGASAASGASATGQSNAGPDATAVIGVLLLFTLVFCAVLSAFTRARRHEILGAAAAYCAVLVGFLSNVGSAVGAVGGGSGSSTG
jgi:hypothetical protein